MNNDAAELVEIFLVPQPVVLLAGPAGGVWHLRVLPQPHEAGEI